MPALQNPKHERFAQELAKGKTADEAYANAGYKANRGNAATLKANQSILDRVSEIQERGVIRTEITVASLLREASKIQNAALKANQHSAAVAALTAKAKLAGLWIDKAENLNRNVDANSLSDAELAAAVVEGDSGKNAPAAPSNPSKLN